MLQRYLFFWLVAISLLAFFWVKMLPEGVIDPFGVQVSDYYLDPLIVITMFAIGLMLPRDEIQQVLRRWPAVLGGSAIQYATMPLLAYGCATLFGFEGDAFIGIVMVGCVPGAMASNVLTMNARGNTSYSVSLTTVATLLSPIVVPFTLWLTLSGQEVAEGVLLKSSWKLLLLVVLPVIAGHLLSRWAHRFENWETRARKYGAMAANLAILLIIAAVVGRNRERLEGSHTALLATLLAINVGGYVAGYFGGKLLRLPEPMRRALTLEVGMQNAGLGVVLAIHLFPDQGAVAIAPAAYTFGCMLTGTLLAKLWSLYPAPGA